MLLLQYEKMLVPMLEVECVVCDVFLDVFFGFEVADDYNKTGPQ